MTDYRDQRFGNYQLIELLGKGGYAQVYLGEQIFLKTRAAIKVLDAPLEEEKVEQFRFEAGIVARLDHPHIVRLLDFGVEHTVPYLVMDYAPNGSLRQRYPHGMPVPPPIVIRYVQEVASALDYAHQQRLIHRDIKPENLLLGRKNQVLLSDFGIAVVAHRTKSMTTQNEVGTIGYMAPEQLRRRPRPASDQYALAVIVYEWLTGIPPFQGSPIEVAMQHLELPPPPMREPGSPISADMERVVLRAMEKHWQMRYANVRDFALALQEAYSPRPPFIRAAPAEASFSPPEHDALIDYAPTVTPRLPALTPELDMGVPRELPEQETLKLKRYTPLGEPTPDDPSGERRTDPDTRPPQNSGPPVMQRSGPQRQNRRKALLVLVALLLIGALSLGGLLLALGGNHSALGNGAGLTNSQTQGAQQHTPSATGSSPVPTRKTTPAPGASATPGATPSTTPGTTPTTTPTGSASPTPTTTTPNLSVSPGSLTFSLHILNCTLNNQPQYLTLQNTGGESLDWQATVQNPTYVTIDHSSGTLNPGDTSSVGVTANCPISGSRSDSITFQWADKSVTVAITINAL
ncbi:MAG TPA: protein kinase [Ktedonobacterales bacterium]|nr:protein kinase [Ktedonobacterales bacterium]